MLAISARDQYQCIFDEVTKGVTTINPDGFQFTGSVINFAAEDLKFEKNIPAIFLPKRTVLLHVPSDDKIHKFSGRNTFKGKVTKVVNGAVNSLVTVECVNIIIVASINCDSYNRLNIAEGSKVIIKTSFMIANY